MPPPRVALIVDHPSRDLAGLVLTAHALCRRGVVCHLVPLNSQRAEVWALAPDFVLLNYMRRGNDRWAAELAAAGIGLGVLDTEGGVWEDPAAYSELLWTDAALRSRIACMCIWGPRIAEHLVERAFLDRRQYVVTGCPRFDFYHPTWRAVLDAPDGFEAGYILVNTNFSCGNPRFATVEQNVRRLRDGLGWSAERVTRYLETERMGRDAIVELTRRLARDFPDRQIVLRPHPFEDPAFYERGTRGVTGVALDGSGPVQTRILRAAAVIQRSCSTAIEAGLAGVPALSPQWVGAPMPVPSAEAVSVPCDSYDALRQRLAAVVRGRFEPPPALTEALDGVVAEWFYRRDGYAHQRVSEAVAARAAGARAVDERQCATRLADTAARGGLGWRRAARGAAARARRAWRRLSRSASSPSAWERGRSEKRFDAPQVRELVARIDDALRRQGIHPGAVAVAAAAESGDYVHAHAGGAVTLRPGSAER